MGIDAVIAAGDGKAARKVFKTNKALLDVGGKPMIRHIVETLIESDHIDKIIVVGPTQSFEEVLDGLDVHLVEQKRSLAENGWEGFLQTLPEYRQTGVLTDDIISRHKDKYVLFLSGDIPLLSTRELDEFISKCNRDAYDYFVGITSEEILSLFGPRKGRPGIKMATFHSRDGNFRQNNLHMARPFALFQGIDLVLSVYEYRYQKELYNIIKTLIAIIKLAPGYISETLALYLLLQISAGLSSVGLWPLARLVSFPVTKPSLERLVSHIFKARCKIVETTIGGAALDVDNEKDFMIISVMYKDWKNMIA